MKAQATARAPILALLALCLIPVSFHLIILAVSPVRFSLTPSLGGLLKLGFVAAAAMTHWAIYGSLLLTFGSTLRAGREPLVSAMARRLHGELSGEMLSYTRRVTIAWSGFFAAQLTLSVALFFFAPLAAWSFFVNILDIPLVCLMFLAEYACRLRCLKNPPRDSLGAILKMIQDVRKPRHGKMILS